MEKGRYEEIVRGFAGRQIVVLGDLMVDHYVIGQVNRISPESPTMIVEVVSEERIPGGAANVVNNLGALGARGVIVGVVGEDENGVWLRAELAARGVDVSGIVVDRSRPTTIKTRILAQNRQLLRVDREQTGAVGAETTRRLQAAFAHACRGADASLVSDYDKGVLTTEMGASVIAVTRASSLLLAANPKPATAARLRGADVIVLNQAEAEGLSGQKFPDSRALERHGAELAERLDVALLVVTQGARGLTLWQRYRSHRSGVPFDLEADAVRHVPAHPVEVYDVAGAGDTAISALTLGLVSGADIEEAATIANHAAACVVRKVGVAAVSPEELLADWSR